MSLFFSFFFNGRYDMILTFGVWIVGLKDTHAYVYRELYYTVQ